MSTSAPSNQLDPQIAKLELTGVTTVFNSVSGFSIDLGVIAEPLETTPQGEISYGFRMGGLPQYGDLMCQAKLSKTDTSLFTWWNEISAGVVSPKDGTLTLMNAENAPQATFKIVGALLTSLSVSDHGIDDPSAAGVTATLNCLSYDRLS